jgi:hypothetical protein
VDYHIYDKANVLSDNYSIDYYYMVPGELKIVTHRQTQYHALSCLQSIKNASAFFRDKFRYMHFFEADTIPRFPEYIDCVHKHLQKYTFAGSVFSIRDMQINGIVTNYFSCELWWFDDLMINVDTWDHYKREAKDCSGHQILEIILESWMYNYFAQRNVLKDCSLLTVDEIRSCFKGINIEVRGNKEPALKVFLSEMENHKLLLLVYLDDYAGRSLPIVLNIHGHFQRDVISQGVVLWRIVEKSGFISVCSEQQTYEFRIDPDHTYTDTTFKFYTDSIKCLTWDPSHNRGFIHEE